MVELHFVYVVLYAIVTIVSLVVVLTAWHHRAASGAIPVAAMMLGVAIWAGAYAAMWYAPVREQQILWWSAAGLGTWVVPVAFLALAFTVAGMERWRRPWRIAILSAVSFALSNIGWINPGNLYDERFVARAIGPYTAYVSVPGPLYWTNIAFAYAMAVAGLGIVLRVYLRSSGTERDQAATLLLGGLVPFVASVVTEVGHLPLGELDLAPIAFLVTGVLWLTAILRGTLLEILPLARAALVEQMPDGVLLLDAEGRVADVNPAALAMLRVSAREVCGESGDAVLGGLEGAAALLGGTGPRHSVLSIGAADDPHFVELEIAPLSTGLGSPPAQLLTLHDVTEERRAAEHLELSRQVFDTADEGIVVTLPDTEMEIIDVNDAFCRMTGRSREDAIGRGIACLRSDRHSPEFYEAMQQSLFTEGEWKGEVWQARVDGSVFPSWLSLTVTKDVEGRPKYFAGVFTDITQIREAEERRAYDATHDALTGLPNRALLENRLEHALAHARREGEGAAVLFVGVDGFRNVNDALGHSQGDLVLVEVARRIASVARESDTVGRFGGDEFMMVVTDGHDPADAKVVARRVFEAMALPFRLGDGVVHLAVSAGVAVFPADAADAGGLIQRADIAMHHAKESGSGGVQFFSEEIQTSIDQRMALEDELWGADEEGRYFLLYQPQVDLSTGRITGVEALVRLRARDGSVVSPADFIPVAEHTELILQLGAWVLREACTQLMAFRAIDPELVMSVNLSARQFREIDVTSLREVLRSTGVEAGSLALEITETAILVDPQRAADRLNDLRDATGIRLALDDFGTGYSSLTYVRMFRADTIKIDRSFISPLPGDPDAQAIVLSIIGMAHGLGATVVAEGPETEEQVRFLQANGCETAQGFYFSRPVPPSELTVLLRVEPFELPDVSDANVRSAKGKAVTSQSRPSGRSSECQREDEQARVHDGGPPACGERGVRPGRQLRRAPGSTEQESGERREPQRNADDREPRYKGR